WTSAARSCSHGTSWSGRSASARRRRV
ncbi:MAG: hypothetical protein AVDCRST_MAG89-1418, partial [uncultured Gemmatimonadetes bacterium]